jgi:hypothetical protein
VAHCDGCGRPMCLACATPVRGKTYGAECLAAAIGADAPVSLETGRLVAIPRRVARIAFVACLATTALPWSRFGAGSDAFGAWSGSLGWSMLAAVASVAGVLLAVAGRIAPRAETWIDVASIVAAAAVVLGSAMSLVRPPSFIEPWLGPWLALVGGVVAAVASAASLRRIAEREAVHV